MSDTKSSERRRTDYEVRIIFGLLSVILGGLTWWMAQINTESKKIPVLEEKFANLQVTVNEIRGDVKSLLLWMPPSESYKK